MNNNPTHKAALLKQLQEQLCLDIDAPLIIDVAKHLEECPDCRVYVDSVQQMVKIYRVTEKDQTIPEGISDRLFKVLKLK
ncbi:MAG: hypothetical protein ACE5D2_05005 [Fidelibacterota bacterium]